MTALNDSLLVAFLQVHLEDFSFLDKKAKANLNKLLFDKLAAWPNLRTPFDPRRHFSRSSRASLNKPKKEIELDTKSLYGFSIKNALDPKDFRTLWKSLLSAALTSLKAKDPEDIDSLPRARKIKKFGDQDYGLNEIFDYFEKFSNFESLLYGSNKFYRDHFYHLFSVWLLGAYFLKIHLKKNSDYCLYLDCKEFREIQFDEIEIDALW